MEFWTTLEWLLLPLEPMQSLHWCWPCSCCLILATTAPYYYSLITSSSLYCSRNIRYSYPTHEDERCCSVNKGSASSYDVYLLSFYHSSNLYCSQHALYYRRRPGRWHATSPSFSYDVLGYSSVSRVVSCRHLIEGWLWIVLRAGLRPAHSHSHGHGHLKWASVTSNVHNIKVSTRQSRPRGTRYWRGLERVGRQAAKHLKRLLWHQSIVLVQWN